MRMSPAVLALYVAAGLSFAAGMLRDWLLILQVPAHAAVFGMMYAAGRTVQPDLITAHKWFNLAAMRGNCEAIRLRREIAEEMSAAEIAAAQRAARDWLTTH